MRFPVAACAVSLLLPMELASQQPPPPAEALEQKLNEYALERGELALTVPMACVVAQRRNSDA